MEGYISIMEANAAPRRPYAAAANVIAVLERARTRNLPDAVDDDFLRIAGVGEAVFGRVTQAMQFLDFIQPDGTPTDRLRSIAAAPEAEYHELLAASIREAYAPEFRNIDPEQDDQPRIIDAFRRYEPRSQTNRMVMLFLGLCRAAGIPVRDAPRERGMQRATPRQTGTKRTVARRNSGNGTAGSGASRQGQQSPPAPGLLFGVSESDINALGDEDFNEVWAALGKVARARARAQAAPLPPTSTVEDSTDDEDEDEA